MVQASCASASFIAQRCCTHSCLPRRDGWVVQRDKTAARWALTSGHHPQEEQPFQTCHPATNPSIERPKPKAQAAFHSPWPRDLEIFRFHVSHLVHTLEASWQSKLVKLNCDGEKVPRNSAVIIPRRPEHSTDRTGRKQTGSDGVQSVGCLSPVSTFDPVEEPQQKA